MLLAILVAALAVTGCGAATDWTAKFRTIPSAARCAEAEQIFTAAPHVAGSPEDEEQAQFVLQSFLGSGVRAWVHTTTPLMTLPGKRAIAMLQPVPAQLSLQEAVIPEDPSTSDSRIVPTFNAYSANGTVTAALCYANYGRPEDWAMLPPGFGRGKIALVRYGALFRGLKVRIAQEQGAVGVIIYSDPQDDGFTRGPVFPAGPWRPATSVQRGSAQFLSICPGDPVLTACNGTLKDHVPSVPVQPISYADATLLLRNIGGPVAPPSFQGGLNFTYQIGGANSVYMSIESQFIARPIWSVCAQLDGVQNDSFVLVGNHRDAWTFGGADPNSGSSILLEMVRAFGLLAKAGYRPQRSIRFCSWDGEEYGLLGSTGYAVDRQAELQKGCLAYLNTDIGVGGKRLVAGASPSLKRVFQHVLERVNDPHTQQPLSKLYNLVREATVLGSGSDYTAFLDHLGIPSVDIGFGDDDEIGIYHSAYDDLYWMNHFGSDNSTYDYYVTLAQLLGTAAMDLVDAPALNFVDYGADLKTYFVALQAVVANSSSSTALDLSPLASAIANFQSAAKATHGRLTFDTMLYLERQFLNAAGLQKRPFYKHLIQAPGINTGYGSLTFPGVSQAVVDGDVDTAQVQLGYLVGAIAQAASFLAAGTRK